MWSINNNNMLSIGNFSPAKCMLRRLNFGLALLSSLKPLDIKHLLHIYVQEIISSVSFSSLKAIAGNFVATKYSSLSDDVCYLLALKTVSHSKLMNVFILTYGIAFEH